MARLSVYVPDELARLVREQLPRLNVSATLQAALSRHLACGHETLVCSGCSAIVDRQTVERAGERSLWLALVEVVEPLVWRCATAEGAAAAMWRVANARALPAGVLPRPNRAEREAAKLEAWEAERAS
jgi:hypothetical protein